jgi:hypothetical protein
MRHGVCVVLHTLCFWGLEELGWKDSGVSYDELTFYLDQRNMAIRAHARWECL